MAKYRKKKRKKKTEQLGIANATLCGALQRIEARCI